MAILPKLTYKFDAIPSQIPMSYFTGIEKIQGFIWNHKISQIAKAFLRSKIPLAVL